VIITFFYQIKSFSFLSDPRHLGLRFCEIA